MSDQPLARPDAWERLRALTPARIALGRAGSSLPTSGLLDFQLAHARARDAVHSEFDAARLCGEIMSLGVKALCVSSAAPDRATFLQRPDLGRRLDPDSRGLLQSVAQSSADKESASPALAIIVSDGLSALAAHRQVVPLLAAWLPLLQDERRRLTPITVVERGRVAIEDQVGSIFGARVAVILIGERPGLGSPDSLGAYLVYNPRPGLSDADRNCVSNIRPQGLAPLAAAMKLHYLFRESLSRKLSGVSLKDESLAISCDATDGQSTADAPRLPRAGQS